MITTGWTLEGASDVKVGRYDTLFLRGRGFRFRYYDESGALRHALWEWGPRAQEWWFDAPAPKDASTAAMLGWTSDMRGVTDLTSWYVPSLLFDRTPECETGTWNLLPTSWERATTVVFHDASRDARTEFTMDLRAGVVRRVYRVARFTIEEMARMSPRIGMRITPAPHVPALSRMDTLILYEEPTCGLDESAVVAELEKQPW